MRVGRGTCGVELQLQMNLLLPHAQGDRKTMNCVCSGFPIVRAIFAKQMVYHRTVNRVLPAVASACIFCHTQGDHRKMFTMFPVATVAYFATQPL